VGHQKRKKRRKNEIGNRSNFQVSLRGAGDSGEKNAKEMVLGGLLATLLQKAETLSPGGDAGSKNIKKKKIVGPEGLNEGLYTSRSRTEGKSNP